VSKAAENSVTTSNNIEVPFFSKEGSNFFCLVLKDSAPARYEVISYREFSSFPPFETVRRSELPVLFSRPALTGFRGICFFLWRNHITPEVSGLLCAVIFLPFHLLPPEECLPLLLQQI